MKRPIIFVYPFRPVESRIHLLKV